MNFKTLATNIIKGAVVAAVVGALVGLAMPAISAMTGVSIAAVGVDANPLWLGAFFGAWGGLAAAIQPIADKIFGKDKSGYQEPKKSESKASTPTIELSPEPSKEMSGSLTHFQDRVKNGRATQDNSLSI